MYYTGIERLSVQIVLQHTKDWEALLLNSLTYFWGIATLKNLIKQTMFCCTLPGLFDKLKCEDDLLPLHLGVWGRDKALPTLLVTNRSFNHWLTVLCGFIYACKWCWVCDGKVSSAKPKILKEYKNSFWHVSCWGTHYPIDSNTEENYIYSNVVLFWFQNWVHCDQHNT